MKASIALSDKSKSIQDNVDFLPAKRNSMPGAFASSRLSIPLVKTLPIIVLLNELSASYIPSLKAEISKMCISSPEPRTLIFLSNTTSLNIPLFASLNLLSSSIELKVCANLKNSSSVFPMLFLIGSYNLCISLSDIRPFLLASKNSPKVIALEPKSFSSKLFIPNNFPVLFKNKLSLVFLALSFIANS